MRTDTITRIDTIILPSRHIDTAFYFFQKDTVIVSKGTVTQKYFYNTTDSTVYIDCNCEPYTVIRKVPTYINTVQPEAKQKGPTFREWIGICFALVIATFLATRIASVIKKRNGR